MQVKIHEAYRIIVAVADTSLIGKTFEEDIRQIEVKPNFFGGEEKTREEVIKILQDMDREDATFNIVGEESVNAAIEAGIISEKGIMRIQDIPVALGLF
jgi:hypothetical protein